MPVETEAGDCRTVHESRLSDDAEDRGRIALLLRVALPWLAFAAAISAGAALLPSSVWAVLALAGYAGFVVALARSAPASSILLAPLLVLGLSEFVSGVAIERGATMVETGTGGAPSGAFAHLLLLKIALLTATAWPIEQGWRKLGAHFETDAAGWREQTARLVVPLVLLLALASIILALLAARHGVPLIGGLDRFTYLGRLEGTPYRSIMMNRPVIAPLIGVLIALPKSRRAGFALLGWLLLLSVLFGEKFTSLLLILGGAAIVPLLAGLVRQNALPLRPILAGTVALGALSLPAVLLTYGALDDGRRAWSRLGERAAVQGQLWYLADRSRPPASIDVSSIRSDLASWPDPAAQRAQRAGPRFGLYYVMARFTPTHRLKLAQRGGTGYVFALHPYLLLAGGLPLLLVGGLAVALFHGWALALLLEALAKGHWLAALAFARLVNSAYASLTTGYLWNSFGIKSLATLALGLFLLRAAPACLIYAKKIPLRDSPQRV